MCRDGDVVSGGDICIDVICLCVGVYVFYCGDVCVMMVMVCMCVCILVCDILV